MASLRTLPPCPPSAYDPVTYRARCGHFAGSLDEVRWGYHHGWLYGQVRRALIRKRWFDVVVHTDRHTLFVHLQDDGTTGHGRVVVLDRNARHTLAWGRGDGAPLRTLVVGPMAGRGTDAFLHAPGLDLSLSRPSDATAWSLHIDGAGVQAALTLDTADAPSPTLLVGEGEPPYAHRPGLTQHHPWLAVSGTLQAAGRLLPLDGGTAHLTYANAFLPPEVRDHRVIADGTAPDGTPVALALADGDLHGTWQEATVWWGDTPFGLPAVRVLDEGQGRDVTWRVLSLDGAVDLTLAARARTDAHATRQLGRVQHDHIHLAGTLSGTLPRPDGTPTTVEGLRGWGTRLRLRG